MRKSVNTISGVDYYHRKKRFEALYEFLSFRFNSQIRVKTFVNETKFLTSIFSIFVSVT
jgi:NADH:ubiquinone oxidoreductase subunit C